MELYGEQFRLHGKRRADIRFVLDVLLLFRPGIIRPANNFSNVNSIDMLANYLRVGIRNILKYKNINASIVTSLAEAKDHLLHNDPPVIFLDNKLSDGLGVEHIRLFKKDHPHSCIIMITAHDSSADREKAYREGADFFIGKPFSRDIIYKTLEKINFP